MIADRKTTKERWEAIPYYGEEESLRELSEEVFVCGQWFTVEEVKAFAQKIRGK